MRGIKNRYRLHVTDEPRPYVIMRDDSRRIFTFAVRDKQFAVETERRLNNPHLIAEEWAQEKAA